MKSHSRIVLALLHLVCVCTPMHTVPLDADVAIAATTATTSTATASTLTNATTLPNETTNDGNKLMEPVHIVTATSVPLPLTTTATTSTITTSAADVETSKNVTHMSSDKMEQHTADAVETANTEHEDEQVVSASNPDTTVYGTYSPEAIQHYLHQYGPAAAAAAAAAAYGPYGGAAAYPAPIGYAPVPQAPVPAIYPSPYMVQTGYEGFLVPTTSSSPTTTTTGTTTTSTTPSTNGGNSDSNNDTTSLISLLNPLTLLTNFFPALMMSTLFRVFATVISVVGMIFLGNTLTSAICHFTPLCDMSFRAVTYLRQRGAAKRIGHFIADEANKERVRRAGEFLQNAIQKYTELQKLVQE